MFTNFQKVIANRVIHKSPRGVIFNSGFLRINPVDFANHDESIANTLMANYRHQRLDESLEYYHQVLSQLPQKPQLCQLIDGYRENIPKHFRDQTVSIIAYNQVDARSLPIESITNLLYLIAKFNQRNSDIEAAVIERLKEKDLDGATVSNIGDLLFYFQNTPEASKNHNEFVEQVAQRAQSFVDGNFSIVQPNGSTIDMYEASSIGGHSTIEQAVITCLETKGKSDRDTSIKFKYLYPIRNILLSLFTKKLNKDAWLYETSSYNELERVRAYLANLGSE
jgi:hypothetical protein